VRLTSSVYEWRLTCTYGVLQYVLCHNEKTLHGMAQTTVSHTDRILKAMDRHILNGDMLKVSRSTKGPGVANRSSVASTPCDRMTALSQICWKPAVNAWTILLSVLKTRTPWRAYSHFSLLWTIHQPCNCRGVQGTDPRHLRR